jgi:hypothetical protein
MRFGTIGTAAGEVRNSNVVASWSRGPNRFVTRSCENAPTFPVVVENVFWAARLKALGGRGGRLMRNDRRRRPTGGKSLGMTPADASGDSEIPPSVARNDFGLSCGKSLSFSNERSSEELLVDKIDPARSIFDTWVSERFGTLRARDFSNLLMASVLILSRAGGRSSAWGSGGISELRSESLGTEKGEYWDSRRSREDWGSSLTAEVRPGVIMVVAVIGYSDAGERGIEADETCLLNWRFSRRGDGCNNDGRRRPRSLLSFAAFGHEEMGGGTGLARW